MSERIVIGYIEYVIDQGLFLTLDDGTVQELYMDDMYRIVPYVPLNCRVAILVDENWNVSKSENFFYELEAPALRNTTDKRISMGIQRGGDHDAGLNMARSAANFWAQMSEGHWTVRGFGFAIKEEYANCNPHFSEYCHKALYDTFIGLPNRPDWTPNYWHVAGGSREGACGSATVGGNRGVTYHTCGQSTFRHELGHNFGLLHSNVELPDGTREEYEDRTSIMGSHAQEAGLHPPHAFELGFYKEDEVRRINKNSQFVVCPWEMNKRMRSNNEKPFNIVETDQYVGREKHFISVRKQRGTPHGAEEGVVFIHRANSASWLLDRIAPGEESKRIPGVTVKHIEHKNEVSLVEVIYDNDKSVPNKEKIQDEKFPVPLAHTEVNQAHDGLWYNANMNGQGLDVHIKGGRMNIYWYTYQSPVKGVGSNKAWFVAECDLKNGPEVFDIFTVEDADFNNPSVGDINVIGKGQFYCLDNNNAVLSFLTKDHGRGSVNLTKLAASDSPNDGAWYNPNRNKEGFTLRFMDNGNRCVGFWYTFSTSNNNPFFPIPASAIWYMLDGTKQEDGSYVLDCINTDGEYRFLKYNMYDVDYEVIGQVTLTPKGDKFVFESNINNRELTSELQKIF